MERTNMGYNETKREVLNIVDSLGTATSKEIALITNRTHEASAMALFRYHKQGLLNRNTLVGRTKIYSITEKGSKRLEWLDSLL